MTLMNCIFDCDSKQLHKYFPLYILSHSLLEIVSFVAIAANKNRKNLALNRELR